MPHRFGKLETELVTVFVRKRRDVRREEERAVGRKDMEARTFETRGEEVALLSQHLSGLDKIVIALVESLGDRVLKRRSVHVGEELLRGADRRDELADARTPTRLSIR